MSQQIKEVLKERGNKYGTFEDNSNLTQIMKDIVRNHHGWTNLNLPQREALDMIFHKISRIMNGDPNYDDSWVDIVGYTQLVVNQIRGNQMPTNGEQQ